VRVSAEKLVMTNIERASNIEQRLSLSRFGPAYLPDDRVVFGLWKKKLLRGGFKRGTQHPNSNE
jgi:hypothetical protein